MHHHRLIDTQSRGYDPLRTRTLAARFGKQRGWRRLAPPRLARPFRSERSCLTAVRVGNAAMPLSQREQEGTPAVSFDDLISAGEERWGDREVEGLGRPYID